MLVALFCSSSFAQKDNSEKKKPEIPNALKRVGRGLKESMQFMSVPKARMTDSPYIRAAFRDVVAKPSKATVRIQSNGRSVALGGIVGTNGWILTKASLLKGKITVRLQDKKSFKASVVGINEDYDLAMLKLMQTIYRF